MKQKNLIKIYSDKPQTKFCHHCEGHTFELTSWYSIKDPESVVEEFSVYLDCCKDKHGTVVDLEETTCA